MAEKKKVVVVGSAFATAGYSVAVRFVLESLKDRNDVELYLVSTPWAKMTNNLQQTEFFEWMHSLVLKTFEYQKNGGKFDVSVQVTIPGEWQKIAPINIGVTAAMETDRISKQWLEKCYLMDKIIVHSEHSKNSIVNAHYKISVPNGREIDLKVPSSVPIEVVPFPVVPVEQDANFALPALMDFNFLAVAQWGSRKNLEQTIIGFVEAMNNEPVGLILKVAGGNLSNVDREDTKEKLDKLLKPLYTKYPNRKCKVFLLHGYMTDAEMSALYQNPKVKAIVTTTHGEGTCLPILDAASYGLPVVCSWWSGYTDFLQAPTVDKKLHKTVIKPMVTQIEFKIAPVDPSFGLIPQWRNLIEPGMQWCYPDMVSYKNALLDVYKNHSEKLGKAKKLQKHILVELEKSKIYEKMRETLLGEAFEIEAVEIGVV